MHQLNQVLPVRHNFVFGFFFVGEILSLPVPLDCFEKSMNVIT